MDYHQNDTDMSMMAWAAIIYLYGRSGRRRRRRKAKRIRRSIKNIRIRIRRENARIAPGLAAVVLMMVSSSVLLCAEREDGAIMILT